MIKAQKVLYHLIQLRRSEDSNSTQSGERLIDLGITDEMVELWKACAEEGSAACAAETQRLTTLCGQITINGPNPQLEGSFSLLSYAKTALEKIENGTLAAPQATRILAE